MRHALLTAALLTVLPAWARAEVPPPPAPQASQVEPAEADAARWPWLLVLAGAATLAASATFALRASSDQEDWAATHNPDRKAQLKDRGESRAFAADITGAAGLLTAASGALLLWTF